MQAQQPALVIGNARLVLAADSVAVKLAHGQSGAGATYLYELSHKPAVPAQIVDVGIVDAFHWLLRRNREAGGFLEDAAPIARRVIGTKQRRIHHVRVVGQRLHAGGTGCEIPLIQIDAQPELAQVRKTDHLAGIFFGAAKGREQQTCQHGDDRDHRQQLKLSESVLRRTGHRFVRF